MVSSITVLFLATCYIYFKQYYKKLIDTHIAEPEEVIVWDKKLKKKILVFPIGVAILVILYVISFTLIKFAPELENVKLIRRIADIVTTVICLFLFYLDKAELDKKLVVKAYDPLQNL